MAFPIEVLNDIARGKAYYSDLNAQYIQKLEDGCSECTCTVKDYTCLKQILRALDFKVELDEYDDIAKKLIEDMLLIIGNYTIKIPPTVDAGPDQTVPITETAIFPAVITQGSAPITNIQWSIVSGTGTLINANTDTVSVTGGTVGTPTVLKIVVTDGNGRSDSDTVRLNRTAATIKVYYLSKSTNVLPTESEILAADFVNIVPGVASYVVPVNEGGFNFHFVFQLATEPNKIRWADTIDPDNNGVMGVGNTWYATANVAAFEGYGNSFKTEFDNPLSFIS